MASVNVDIGARIAGKDLTRSANEIQRAVHSWGTDAGNDFSRNFHRTLDLNPGRNIDGKGVRTAGARDGRQYSRAFNDAAKVNVDLTQNAAQLTRATQTATASAVQLGNAVGSLSKLGGPAALAGLAYGVVQLGAVAATAAGTIGLLPGVIGAAGAAFGTLAIGTQGFADAIQDMGDPEKFAEALRELAPSAQQAALEIQALVNGPLKELKLATQEALFDGIGPQLSQLASTLGPELQRLTTSVATSFNQMFTGAVSAIDPNVFTSISSSIQQAFQNLAPAIQPITAALMDLVDVGASFMPELADAATNAANAFATLVSEAKGTGELQQWIADGMAVVEMLGETVITVADTFMTLGGDGVTAMRDIQIAVEAVSTAVKIVSGDMAAWNDVIPSIGDIARKTFEDIAGFIDNGLLQPLREMIKLANKIPGINLPNIPELSRAQGTVGGGGSFDPPGTPPGGPRAVPRVGGIGSAGQGIGDVSQWSGNRINTGIGSPGGSAGSAGPTMPVVPFSGDPMSLLQGIPNVTSGLYSAAGSVLDSQHKVAQENAELNALIASNTATAEELQKARNEVAQAEQDQFKAELNLAEQKKAATDGLAKATMNAHSSFQDLTAALDSDFGASKGLPGLVDNLVRAIASIAAAPLMGPLSVIANGGQSAGGYSSGSSSGGYSSNGSPMGGNVGAMMALAQQSSGNVEYAPASDLVNGLADCSGSISDLVEMLQTGTTSPDRLFTTTNFASDAEAAKLGFAPGYQPGALNVGVNPYPGQSGHMAATLPNGVNFEGGGGTGGGAQYGGTAAGALDPQFEKRYHMPVGGMPTPGMPTGGMPATAPTAHNAASGLATPPLVMPGGPSANTNPGLTPGPAGPLPQPGSVPQGGPLGTGFPNSRTSPSYAPETPSTAPDPAWSPQGGGIGINGGLIGMAVGAASQGAGMAGNMFAPGSGQAAQAAAQMGMQAIDRTVKFAGQAAGALAEGAMSALTWSDPDSGENPLANSWLTRLSGALMGARPAGAVAAGKADEKSKVDPNAPQQQQQGQNGQQPGGNTINNTMNVSPDVAGNGQKLFNEMAYASTIAGG